MEGEVVMAHSWRIEQDRKLNDPGGAILAELAIARWHGLHWIQTTPKADMSIEIQRKPDTALAQTIHIHSHQFDTGVSAAEGGAEFAQLAAVAEKCPVHRLMTTLTTEITTRVERAV
jgi:hypothetical protein